jgi:hypothetical protein
VGWAVLRTELRVSGKFLMERTIDLIRKDIRGRTSSGNVSNISVAFIPNSSSSIYLTPPKTPSILPTTVVVVPLIVTACLLSMPTVSLPPLQAWGILPMKGFRIWPCGTLSRSGSITEDENFLPTIPSGPAPW